MSSVAAWSQEKLFTLFLPSAVEFENASAAQNFHVDALRLEASRSEDEEHGGAADDASTDSSQHKGLVKRSVKRIGADQKRLYLAPFNAHNVMWDALVLVGTGAFIAADRHIENRLPSGHFTLYQDTSDIAVGGLAASLGAIWLYGAKTEYRHARETGELELETPSALS